VRALLPLLAVSEEIFTAESTSISGNCKVPSMPDSTASAIRSRPELAVSRLSCAITTSPLEIGRQSASTSRTRARARRILQRRRRDGTGESGHGQFGRDLIAEAVESGIDGTLQLRRWTSIPR